MDNYYNIKYIYIIIIIQILLVSGYKYAFGQEQQDIQLANEYLSKGEKDKALLMYEQLIKKNENIPYVHSNYLNLLIDMEKFSEAENYLEKVIRKDNRITYRLDLGILYFRSGNLSKADKYIKAIIKEAGDDTYKLKSAADYLASKNMVDYAIECLQQARTVTRNNSIFALELANFYRLAGKRDAMVEEYLNYVTQTPSNITYIKNVLQILLTKPEELESLENLLLLRIQTDQNTEVYPDLIIWVNLQQKNFYGAFIQARAYDKRFRKENSKTLEIGQIAFNNQDYENADRCFAYVTKEFAGTENELPARFGLIKAREAKAKKSYPVKRDSIQFVINEYKRFTKSYPENKNSYDATLNIALLQAYYLQQMDSGIYYLQPLVANNKVAPAQRAKAKIELGDIYLLKEEPWEATLLYSQVEKSQRESVQGYEAKLRNAKLSYFKGDFLLAQEHLDILKQATTREIANDAMELSLRIKENTTFDTTGFTLKKYASIELLIAQNKKREAISELEKFITTLTTEPIKDDALWLEANLRLEQGEFEKAIAICEQIVTEFGEDVLADDAYFLEGEITERYLNNKDKAMEIYREFLNKYPGSVYVAEARKRFRQLRGDFSEAQLN
jgi:tetratricopeptide (TPR) repeat protein